jgi:hypothetical protein
MTDKAPPAGWVVQVTVPALPTPSAPTTTGRWIGPVKLGAPSFQYFNVAIADAHKATEATGKHLGIPDDDDRKMHAVRRLSEAEIAALSLNAGEVKPA